MTVQKTALTPSSRAEKPFLQRHGNKLYMIALSLFTIFWMLPIIWTLVTSFRPEIHIQANVATLIPNPFTTENWTYVLNSSKIPPGCSTARLSQSHIPSCNWPFAP